MEIDFLAEIADVFEVWPSWLMMAGMPIEIVDLPLPAEERHRMLLEWGRTGQRLLIQ